MELYAEVTQGDPYYDEIAFVDQYGAPKDLTDWTIEIAFRTAFSGPSLIDLTQTNGISFPGLSPVSGVISLAFDANVLADLDINPRPRNGQMVPSRVVIGDVKLTPPDGVELIQGMGARTTIFLTVKAAIT